MKGLKKGQIIMIAAFAAVLYILGTVWFFAGKAAGGTGNENRAANARPVLSAETYRSFSKDYEAYFNDRIPLRSEFITLNSCIDYFLFKVPSNTQVLVGKGRWLFYCDSEDGDPIGAYHGENLYTEEELRAMADNCIAQRDFLESMGKEFVIMIIPDKERMYHEYMPDRFGEPAETFRMQQVVDYLRANTDLRVVYPYEQLLEAKEKLPERIYYRIDTHWNGLGGYIGAAMLLEELGIDMPSIYDEGVTFEQGPEKIGDLAKMLGIAEQLKSADHEYHVRGYDDHGVYTESDLEENFYDFFEYSTDGSADPRKIYARRDSFFSAMAEYVGSQFAESTFCYSGKYSFEDFMERDADIFVLETVERYIDDLSIYHIKD